MIYKNRVFGKDLLVIKVLCMLLALPFMGWGHSLKIKNAYARPTKGQNGAIFMVIENPSAQHRDLVSAKTSICDHMELHTHLRDGDIFRMRPLSHITINPGSSTCLKPGSLHLMLMKLKKPLKRGDRFEVTLTFRDGSHMTLEVPVKKGSGCCCKKKKRQ